MLSRHLGIPPANLGTSRQNLETFGQLPEISRQAPGIFPRMSGISRATLETLPPSVGKTVRVLEISRRHPLRCLGILQDCPEVFHQQPRHRDEGVSHAQRTARRPTEEPEDPGRRDEARSEELRVVSRKQATQLRCQRPPLRLGAVPRVRFPYDRQERLHALVEDLPEGEAETAVRFPESPRQDAPDAVARALRNAPLDDEPLTPDDLAALVEADRDWQEGRVVSDDEARHRFLRRA